MSVKYKDLLRLNEVIKLTIDQQQSYIRFLWGIELNTVAKIAHSLGISKEEYLDYAKSGLNMKPSPKEHDKKRYAVARKTGDGQLTNNFDVEISIRGLYNKLENKSFASSKSFWQLLDEEIKMEVEKMNPEKIGIVAMLKKEAPERDISDLTDADRDLLIKISGILPEKLSSLGALLNDDKTLQDAGEYISKVCNFFGISVNRFFTTYNNRMGDFGELDQTRVYHAVYEFKNPGKSYRDYLKALRTNRENGGKNRRYCARGTRAQVKAFEIFMGITHEEESAPTDSLPEISPETSPENSSETSPEVLAFYGIGTGKTISGITGKTLNSLNKDDVKTIVKFCPLKPLSGAEFKSLRTGVQKLYLFELAQFSLAAWGDIARFWFHDEITGEDLKSLYESFGLPPRIIVYSQFVTQALQEAAQNATSFETRAKLKDLEKLRTAMLKVLDGNAPYEDRAKAVELFNTILDLPHPTDIVVWHNVVHKYVDTEEEIPISTNLEVTNESSTPPQNDSVPFSAEETEENRSEEEAGEIPPVAESKAVLLPTGEVVLEESLETELKFGEIDTFYSLRVKLPYEGYCEIEEILRKYRRAGAAKILQASYSDLDVMSLEA